MSLKEKVQRNSPRKTVQIARGRLGERGYAILSNNCETFANECVFGKKISSQVEDVRELMKTLPICDVYLLPLEDGMEPGKTGNAMRDAELEGIGNPQVKLQKYEVWKLLEYAIQRTFGRELEQLEPKRDEHGKILLEGYCCSLSHCRDAVAVAVSRDAVGVDVEKVADGRFRDGIERKILSEKEKQTVPQDDTRLYELTKRWTQKESLFKAYGSGAFDPKKQDTDENADKLATRSVFTGDTQLLLSAASEHAGQVRWYLAFEKENRELGAKIMPEDTAR